MLYNLNVLIKICQESSLEVYVFKFQNPTYYNKDETKHLFIFQLKKILNNCHEMLYIKDTFKLIVKGNISFFFFLNLYQP